MLRSGRSLNSQPEKTRYHWSSRCSCTLSCTNAPVSGGDSHGGVVSQARSRTIARPTRALSPGRISRSRTSPLRLLSSEITATRCAIGVAPSVAPAARAGLVPRAILVSVLDAAGPPSGP